MLMKFYVKQVYGKPRNYLVDPKQAEAFTKLTGRATLSADDFRILEVFGVKFEQVNEPIK